MSNSNFLCIACILKLLYASIIHQCLVASNVTYTIVPYIYIAAPAQCFQGAIRLQGGTATSGRVEICNNNVWGTVCDDLWGDIDAQVVCRQLGFISVGATALTSFNVPAGTGQIWLDNVSCRGTETRLIDCPANPLGTHNCGHVEDAGVRCRGGYTFYLETEQAVIISFSCSHSSTLSPRSHQTARRHCH